MNASSSYRMLFIVLLVVTGIVQLFAAALPSPAEKKDAVEFHQLVNVGEGRILVGDYGGGGPIAKFQRAAEKKDAVEIHQLSTDGQGRILVGDYGGGGPIAKFQTGRVLGGDYENVGGPIAAVHQLSIAGKGRILAGDYGGGGPIAKFQTGRVLGGDYGNVDGYHMVH